jgi:hypothetical protein
MELLQTLNILLTIQPPFLEVGQASKKMRFTPSTASILKDSGYNGYRTPFPIGVIRIGKTSF